MADKYSTFAAQYRMFGRYNAWVNGRLLAAAAALSVEQYRADRGAFDLLYFQRLAAMKCA